MQHCSGNVGAVVAQIGNQTLRMLEQLQIPYDEIHFGQVPRARRRVSQPSVLHLCRAHTPMPWPASQPFAHVYVDASVACR